MILGGVWRKFLDLLPSEPRLVGVVAAVVSTGRFSVQLTGGGFVQVVGEGAYSVSDRVFIKGKKIESKAPALTSLTIEV
jgi:hypothetical protein